MPRYYYYYYYYYYLILLLLLTKHYNLSSIRSIPLLLMTTISHEKYQQYGYLWWSKTSLHPCSWLQFADDTALIAHSAQGAQILLNTTLAWCNWSSMKVRIDKCSTFGMTKYAGQYTQFKPLLFINDEAVPAVNNGEAFTYLGKTFDFKMDNSAIKATLVDRLRQLLQVTSNLKIRPQLKLKILHLYIRHKSTLSCKCTISQSRGSINP